MNARRELVWHYEGDPDPGELAAALDKYLVPLSLPESRPLALTVSPAQRPPDAYFEDGGRQFAIHRLRNAVINFWQSWSAPCLTELRRLQAILDKARDGREPAGAAPFIVAFHGGKDAKALERVRKELGISFVLAQDPGQRIAQRYGVRCWPTTITLDGDGVVESIQFGLSPTHNITYGAQTQASSQATS
jgi:thiol-disulfide isomerase/thioredoxin